MSASVEIEETPDALDGLGQALWWMKRPREGIEARTRAYAGYKDRGDFDKAAHLAVWLAREHLTLFANSAAAEGWLHRAQSLGDRAGAAVLGWTHLARAAAETDPDEVTAFLVSALEVGRKTNDGDLEILSLARLGVTQIGRGLVEDGVGHLDEAMAAASAGEGRDPQTLAEAYCALTEASDLLGDRERLSEWAKTIDPVTELDLGSLAIHASGSVPSVLSAFCGACCGGIYMVTGAPRRSGSGAVGIDQLSLGTGMRSRCVHPITQLADLRVVQGRIEEARSLLAEYEDLPEAVRPLAMIDLALGEPESALRRLDSRIAQLEELPVLAFPLWLLVVEAELAHHAPGSAAEAVQEVERVALLTGSLRHEGLAAFYRGAVAAATSDPSAADDLREAATKLAGSGLVLMSCRARLALARALVDSDRPLAIVEARSALAAFERLGASHDADAAAAFLRDLGVRGRTGPKDVGVLSKREIEVLRLVAQGMTNTEIATRLFISVKTAGHHVSSILLKLGLRSRTEAAAFAAVQLGPERAHE